MPYPVRYARTSDGVSIAFTELGEGEPLIYLPALPWCNFTAGFANPLTASHAEELSAFARVLVYDARGCGLSDHGVTDLSLDGLAHDIDAVANAAGARRFALYGSADACRVMVHYAATRPERVEHLILWIPSAGAARLRDDPALRAVTSLAGRDWELYLRTFSHAVVGGWDDERGPYAAAFADLMRAAIGPDEFRPFVDAMRTHDVSAELAAVRARTLVLARQDAALMTVPVVREVAAGIRDARFVISPGNWLLPCTSDDITREIADFISGPARRRGPATSKAAQSVIPFPMRTPPVAVPPREPAGLPLSPREQEVLALLSQGKTNAQIAADLVVAPATVSRHVHNILNKLGMQRRAEAAAYAAMRGLAPERARTLDA